MSKRSTLVADHVMRPELVVVSTPILHYYPYFVKAHEPVRVQALEQVL